MFASWWWCWLYVAVKYLKSNKLSNVPLSELMENFINLTICPLINCDVVCFNDLLCMLQHPIIICAYEVAKCNFLNLFHFVTKSFCNFLVFSSLVNGENFKVCYVIRKWGQLVCDVNSRKLNDWHKTTIQN